MADSASRMWSGYKKVIITLFIMGVIAIVAYGVITKEGGFRFILIPFGALMIWGALLIYKKRFKGFRW